MIFTFTIVLIFSIGLALGDCDDLSIVMVSFFVQLFDEWSRQLIKVYQKDSSLSYIDNDALGKIYSIVNYIFLHRKL